MVRAMSPPPAIALEIAPPTKRDVIENLFQLYTHDFSEQWAGQARGELGEDGRFAPYSHLDSYWREPERVPLLIRTGGHLAGFALLNRYGRVRPAPDRAMAEFFIVRKHRLSGVGRKNTAALAFWRRTVGTYPRAAEVEELDLNSADWNGPVLRFRIGNA